MKRCGWILLMVWMLSPLMGLALPKNVIFMVPDGTGHASLTVARQLKGAPLALDRIIYGTIQTRSADSSVTDSAAAATAMACGVRTYNGAIAVNMEKTPLLTLGELAHRQGKAVGCVTTDNIAGATPGAFSAHALSRNQYGDIFEQQLTSGFDLFFGGGRKLLTGERKTLLADQGFTLVTTADEMKAAQGRVVGLFADDIMTAMVQRRSGAPCSEPTLPEMADKALELLSKNPNGFFLLIEGAQVDKGNHDNDLPWATYEMLAFDETVERVLAWAKAHPGTVIMIAPDHETGGLTILPEPKEGARVKALSAITAKGERKGKKFFVNYSTGGHTGVDVFLAGNTPALRPMLNCDMPQTLGLTPEPLKALTGETVMREGKPFLKTPDGKLLQSPRDALYISGTGKWFAR